MENGEMNGGEILVETLLSRGIEAVFFVPGGTFVTVLDALSRVQNRIRSIPTRLESAAAFACDAYAGISRIPACMFVSRAPGASNAVIGVHNAMQASRPFVLFIADIPKDMKGREAFQEIDYRLMYAPVAKAVLEVHSFHEVAAVTARALDLAVSGRPGPVVCVVSRDILDGETGVARIPKPAAPVTMGADPDAVAAAAQMIRNARFPILLAGEMIAIENQGEALAQLAAASGAGVLTAYRQQDVIDNDNPAFFGQLALNRLPFQSEALADCDLIVNIGCRFDSVTTADYTLLRDDQKVVMIYPDAAVFSQWQVDVAIGSLAGPAMTALSAALAETPPPAARIAWRDAIHAKEAAYAEPGDLEIHGDVDMSGIIQTFMRQVPDDTILSSDAGTFGRWIQRFYRFHKPYCNLGPISGAMGYGLPGAIGAQIAAPDRMVFAWIGDGGFLMTGHEAAAIVQENLAVKIIVCDNAAWGSILAYQQKRFGDRDFGTRLKSPNFATLAEGYGMAAFSVQKTAEFADALSAAMAHDGPALIHLILDTRDVSPYTGSAR